jgi:hypothetical protein
MAKRLIEPVSERQYIRRCYLLSFGTLVYPQSLEPAGIRALKESPRVNSNGIASSYKDACVVDRCEAAIRIKIRRT